jgi:2',3'-cyclic-nucleotide 2'-phosphodiesterase (5'-nucleotidase family)
MIILTQLVCFITVLLILLQSITSILNIQNDQILDFIQTPSAVSSKFNPYSRITLKQQLKSRLPNLNEPLRPLQLGKLNFLHTTDTHGWVLGHTNQRQYSADWGDFISFHSNLKQISNDEGGDLLLIDTGDRHDGNGMSDLTTPNGKYSSKIFMMMDYDLITVGNHELYQADVSQFEFENTVPKYGDRFVSTNVQYKTDEGEFVTFGETHRYFQTDLNKYNILAFSFLFDFKMGNERINVIPISTLIHEPWFLNLLNDYSNDKEVDAIVIFGHLPVSHDWLELYELHAVFRKYFPHTYIQYFGGHSHIRDFSVVDQLSTGLQSGRYCETVGFLSMDELPTSDDEDTHYIKANIHRRYIDFNIHSFMNHTRHTNLKKFNTEKGLFVSSELAQYAAKLGLDETYGSVPHSYYMYAADYSNHDSKSLLRFLEDEVLPQLKPKSCISDNDSSFFEETDNDRIILINTGGIRYDLYKGDFNKNSLFTVSPFQNKWKVIPSVPTEISLEIQNILNNGDFIISSESELQNQSFSLKSPYQFAVEKKMMNQPLACNNGTDNVEINEKRRPISYGYTTTDDFGTTGDDTIHKVLLTYYVPNVIQSHNKRGPANSDFTDVVFYDFIQPFIIDALEEACKEDEQLFEKLVADVTFYNDCAAEFNLGQLLKKYAIDHWN